MVIDSCEGVRIGTGTRVGSGTPILVADDDVGGPPEMGIFTGIFC